MLFDVKWLLQVSSMSCFDSGFTTYSLEAHAQLHKKAHIQWKENEAWLTDLSINWLTAAFTMNQILLHSLYSILINPQNNFLSYHS